MAQLDVDSLMSRLLNVGMAGGRLTTSVPHIFCGGSQLVDPKQRIAGLRARATTVLLRRKTSFYFSIVLDRM